MRKSDDPRNFPKPQSLGWWLLYVAQLALAGYLIGGAWRESDSRFVFLGVVLAVFWLGILWVARRSDRAWAEDGEPQKRR